MARSGCALRLWRLPPFAAAGRGLDEAQCVHVHVFVVSVRSTIICHCGVPRPYVATDAGKYVAAWWLFDLEELKAMRALMDFHDDCARVKLFQSDTDLVLLPWSPFTACV